jgi:hypothetical protein
MKLNRKVVWPLVAAVSIASLATYATLESNLWVTYLWDGTALMDDGTPYYPGDHVLYYKAVAAESDLTPTEVTELVAERLAITLEDANKLAAASSQPADQTTLASSAP